MNLEYEKIFDFGGKWVLGKHSPSVDGYYMTIRCGLGGIYTYLNEWKDNRWQVEIADDSSVVAYTRDVIPRDEVNAWCREKLAKYKESLKKFLDEQGEQKDILEDAVLDSNKDGLIADTIRYKREKQSEQNPAWIDVLPRLKEGDS